MQILLVIGLVGAVATFVDSIIGMGFGVLSTSLLMTSGVYPAVASASVHVGKVVTGSLSGGAHLWFGNVKKEWLLPLALPGVIGGSAGAYLLASLPGKEMKPYVAGILLVLGLVILHRFVFRRTSPDILLQAEDTIDPAPKRKVSKLPLLGFVAAFVDAIGGGGWGPIATPGLILTGKEEPHKVIGTVNIAEVFAAIAISATFIATLGMKALPWNQVAALMVGGMISAPTGAYLCKRLPTRALGILTALALIVFNLWIIIGTLS